ncbi:hypothetical protein CDV31_013983 [Fusarium ambrosium]|uniref:VOC domain-containing protein n=1 Tax=Fusarium ambrosium TaxID=131363 RepID=A0A428SZL7_9HYPO|nr:hypothetical protein CDV31_013983 [Fusarium ambrosium]
MSAASPISALFAVSLNPSNINESVEFYKDFGFIVDSGYDAVGDIPDEYFAARGVTKSNWERSVALRLPGDPYMHLILNSWTGLDNAPGWPAPYNQLGSRAITLLVGDAIAELARVRSQFPGVRILHDPIRIHRRWGVTTSVLLLDPESVFLELISIEHAPDSPYNPLNVKKPAFEEKQWLHFMVSCSNFDETEPFYKSFGMEHDAGVDFRPGVGFHPFGYDAFKAQMRDAFGFLMENSKGVAFLRSKSDTSSSMHLELCRHVPDSLKNPDDHPTWPQKGISRYCFKVDNYKACLEHQKARGSKIYVEDQRGCLEWGDTQWCFTGDPDGNILTQEQWFPTRYWGERD